MSTRPTADSVRADGEPTGPSRLASAEAAVAAFCGEFDAALLTGVGAAAVMGRVTVLIRMLISVQIRAAQRAVECHIHRGTPYHDGASWLVGWLIHYKRHK